MDTTIWDLPEISSHPTTRHDTTDLFDLLGAPPLTDAAADPDDHFTSTPATHATAVKPSQQHHQTEAWQTFLDDNCPFKRRVKVTRKRSSISINTSTNTNITNDETPRKRLRTTTLSFPPQFPTPTPLVPRRARVAAVAPAPGATLSAAVEPPVRTSQDADLFMGPMGNVQSNTIVELIADDDNSDQVGVDSEVESLCDVGSSATLCGVGVEGVEGSVGGVSVGVPPLTDGFLTPKLVTRLTAILAPVSEVSSASISSTGRSCGGQLLRNDPVVLPCVSAAVAAVSAAATAYRTSLRA